MSTKKTVKDELMKIVDDTTKFMNSVITECIKVDDSLTERENNVVKNEERIKQIICTLEERDKSITKREDNIHVRIADLQKIAADRLVLKTTAEQNAAESLKLERQAKADRAQAFVERDNARKALADAHAEIERLKSKIESTTTSNVAVL